MLNKAILLIIKSFFVLVYLIFWTNCEFQLQPEFVENESIFHEYFSKTYGLKKKSSLRKKSKIIQDSQDSKGSETTEFSIILENSVETTTGIPEIADNPNKLISTSAHENTFWIEKPAGYIPFLVLFGILTSLVVLFGVYAGIDESKKPKRRKLKNLADAIAY